MSRNSGSVTRQSLGTTQSLLKFSDVIHAQLVRCFVRSFLRSIPNFVIENTAASQHDPQRI